jgi:hypothetical protein
LLFCGNGQVELLVLALGFAGLIKLALGDKRHDILLKITGDVIVDIFKRKERKQKKKR